MWQLQCSNMSLAAEGRFPFGVNNLQENDLPLLATMNGVGQSQMEKECHGPAPAQLPEFKRLLRERICGQVRNIVAARGKLTGAATSGALPGPSLSPDDLNGFELPGPLKNLSREQILAKCREPIPESIAEPLKEFTRQLCARVTGE